MTDEAGRFSMPGTFTGGFRLRRRREGAIGGGDQLIKAGAAKELNWFTPQEGYDIFEADSMASVLGMVQGFFPYYSQDVREVVSWDSAKKAILASARQAAAR